MEKVPEQRIINEIRARQWTKNWGGAESILIGSYLVRQYTEHLKAVIGEGLQKALMVFHNGFAESYFIEEHKKKLATFLLEQVAADPSSIEKWTDQLKRKTDYALDVAKRLSGKEEIGEN